MNAGKDKRGASRLQQDWLAAMSFSCKALNKKNIDKEARNP